MTLRLFIFLCMFAFAVPGRGAALPVSKMQNAVSGITQSKMQSRGFSANDPRFNATLSGLGASAAYAAAHAATVTALGVTAPAWATVAAAVTVGAVVAGAVYLAIDAGIKWLFKDGSSVQIGDNVESVNTPAGLPPPGTIYCMNGVCSGIQSAACANYPITSGTQENLTWSATYALRGTQCFQIKTFSNGYVSEGLMGYIVPATNNKTVCPGIGLAAAAGVCPASNFAESAPAPVKTISDAAADLTAPQKAAALNPQILADLANDFWRQAASSAGYDGLPYDATNPITATEASAWQAANPSSWPSVGDFVAPQGAPSGGTAASPFTMPTSPTPVSSADPSTQPSTGTNPSTEPLQNLGPDPGIGAPSLEPIPTAQQIISPLTNVFPSVKSFVVPSIDAQCPTWAVPVFGKEIAFRDHCGMLEDARPTLFAVMAVVYALMALFIVLRA